MSGHESAAAEPHPLVAQLSALHQFRIRVDVAVVVVVLALTNLIAHFTTPWAAIVTVPAAAIGLVAWLRFTGLGWAELGLGREHWKSGAAYAVAAVALVVAVIAVGALLPLTRPMFMNNHYATISGALLASLIIIPLQTVIPEELAFRGVLHGALNRAWGFRGVARRRFTAVRAVAHRDVAGIDEQQRRVHPAVRRRRVRHAGRGHPGGGRDRGGRVRVQLATTTQRQPARADRAALVAQRGGCRGGGAGLAPVQLTGCYVSRTAAPAMRPALRSDNARSAWLSGYSGVVTETWCSATKSRKARASARVFDVTERT